MKILIWGIIVSICVIIIAVVIWDLSVEYFDYQVTLYKN